MIAGRDRRGEQYAERDPIVEPARRRVTPPITPSATPVMTMITLASSVSSNVGRIRGLITFAAVSCSADRVAEVTGDEAAQPARVLVEERIVEVVLLADSLVGLRGGLPAAEQRRLGAAGREVDASRRSRTTPPACRTGISRIRLIASSSQPVHQRPAAHRRDLRAVDDGPQPALPGERDRRPLQPRALEQAAELARSRRRRRRCSQSGLAPPNGRPRSASTARAAVVSRRAGDAAARMRPGATQVQARRRASDSVA